MNDNIVDIINNKVNIVDVISSYVPLTKKGRNYFCVCPFHDDHNPSMSVSPDKKIFNCFVCGAKGGVIKFVQDYEHISFLEAVKNIADKNGIKNNINTNNYTKKENYTKEYEAYVLSNKFYINNLNTEKGILAKKYLSDRLISDEIIKEFGIGLSLGYDRSITKILEKKGYDFSMLESIGLSNNTDYGHSDLFVKRIMFPLHNTSGNIIGYSGRIYNNEDTSKYINTRETYIFKKGLNLYNYYKVRENIRNYKSIIVMEGFMDVIRAHSVSIFNCVATMGTAITVEQAKLLKSLSNNIILCFDGDKAGLKATIACGKELNLIGINPKVVRLEDNLDPDEYILKFGKDRFNDKINCAISFLDFKLDYLKEDKKLDNNEDLAQYINEVIEEVNNIEDDILKELTIKKVCKNINISEDIIFNKLKKENNSTFEKVEEVDNFDDFIPQDTFVEFNEEVIIQEPIINEPIIQKPIFNPKKVVSALKTSNKYTTAQRKIMFTILQNKDVCINFKDKIDVIPNDKYKEIYTKLIDFIYKYDVINIDNFIDFNKNDKELCNLTRQILNFNYNITYAEKEIDDLFDTLSEYNKKNEIKKLTALLEGETNIVKQIEYLEKIKEIKKGVQCYE